MKMQWKATGSVNRIASRPDQRWTRLTCGRPIGTRCCNFPKMRAPVETWIIPSKTAADANHALAAIPDEKTDVIAPVQADSTLASNAADPTRYDRLVSERRVRLLVVPVALLFGASAVAFTLAKWHPASPGVAAAGPVKLGDPYRGQIAFEATCAGCHGTGGKGGGVGPR